MDFVLIRYNKRILAVNRGFVKGKLNNALVKLRSIMGGMSDPLNAKCQFCKRAH